MKKLKIIAALIILFSATSCKKDWNCECSYTDGNTNWTTNSTVEDATKSEAESSCNDSGSLGTSSYSCEIK